MSGDELKQLLKERGVVMTELAAMLGKTQQGLNSNLTVKKVKAEFIRQVEEATQMSFTEKDAKALRNTHSVDELLAIIRQKDEVIGRLVTTIERQAAFIAGGAKKRT